MTKALIVYYSMFGNTEKIARALAEGLQSGGCEVETAKVDTVKFEEIRDIDLLCVGTPVHAWNISKPAKKFLEQLERQGAFNGKRAFAFDTKMKSRMAGTAGGKIEKRLKHLGFEIIEPAKSAIVKGREGPLEEGAEDTFRQLGKELSTV